VLSDLQPTTDSRVLVDYSTGDDAGVYRLRENLLLVQTVDFFTPIVDDPFVYGQIAAANALSDVYAMGGRPLTALAIAGFPKKGLDPTVIPEVFKGGLSILREADVALLGGHTVQDQEIKFGYAVSGTVDADRMLSNAGARPGDVLLLTKPLGTGIIATAMKYDRAPDAVAAAAVRSMVALNRDAMTAVHQLDATSVRACTDITGYGLIGHSTEVAQASNVTLHLSAMDVPLIDGAIDLVHENQTGGGHANQAYFSPSVREQAAISDALRALLYDPQTSGGLLLAVRPDRAEELTTRLAEVGVAAARVGEVRPPHDGALVVIA
jgi:selenide,water dikinase